MKRAMKKKRYRQRICVPKQFTPYLFPFLLSGITTFIVTGLSTIRVLGIYAAISSFNHFLGVWMNSYLYTWLFSYPTLLLMVPVVRRIVNALADNCDCYEADI